jgi:23S rRNA (adenine2503-C2)-methyltransferase
LPEKIHIKTLTEQEFSDFVLKQKESGFRSKQIYEWVWKKKAISFDEMTNIPLSLRQQLSSSFYCSSIIDTEEQISKDGTRKYAFSLSDGSIFESVLIPSKGRVTACISSQIGCALACRFCATGTMGFVRNLDFAEIHDQIIMLMRFSSQYFNIPLSNIVVMGMGEPLLNYENIMKELTHISDKNTLNFSPQRITISTAGITEGIRRMADEAIPFQLAVSLHSAIDSKRRQIMPLANKHQINDIIKALQHYYKKTEKRITIEYLMIHNFNDTFQDAEELALFCRNFPVKINLIPLNNITINNLKGSSPENINKFAAILKSKNIIVNLRQSKGVDIMAACGQLVKNKNQNI